VGVGVSLLAVLVVTPLLADSRLGDLSWRAAGERGEALGTWPAWIVERRRAIVVVSVAAFLAMAAAALSLRPDFRYSEYLPETSETYRSLRLTESRFGGVLPVHVLIEWPERDRLPGEVARAIEAAQRALAGDPRFHAPLSALDVLRATVPTDPPTESIGELIPLADPATLSRLLRADLGRAIVTARVADTGAASLVPMVDALDRRLAAARAACDACRIEVTGLVALAATSSLRIIESLAVSVGVAAILIGVVLAVSFRSIALGMASLLPNALPLAAIGAFLAATGRPLQYTSAVVFSVALGIVVDDTIHLLSAFRRWRADGRGPREAAILAIDEKGRAVIATTALLIAGFGALLLSELPLIRLFGLLSCLAFVVALAGDLIVLPALLAMKGNHGTSSRDTSRH
jgi:predicted RND superfamily exporter protein